MLPSRKVAAAGLMAALAATVATPAMLQDRLLYFPARASVAEMASPDLRPWPDAQSFRGLLAPGTAAQSPPAPLAPVFKKPGVRGTAVVFHGNAGHAGHRAYYAHALTAQALRVVLAEYPGYGPRDGAPGEEAFVADAEETIRLADRLYGGPLLVVGESLGAAVAAAAAARLQDRIDGLLLITPWDRLEHVASFHYPWLPVKWLLRDRYDSAAALKGFRRPILIVVAQQDEIVPARLGLALHEGLAQPKALLTIEAAGHNDWIGRVDATWWSRAIGLVLPERGTPSR
jgi:pimeloyl-ACP methyl ester carboxylesterase